MRIRSNLAMSFAIVVACLLPRPVAAEDLLKTNGVEYLGWAQQNDTKFKTCDGSIIDVGNGTITKNVKERCRTEIQSPPLLGQRADLTYLSAAKYKLAVEDLAGVTHQLTVIANADTAQKLSVAKAVAITFKADTLAVAYATAQDPRPTPIILKRVKDQ